MTAARHPTAVLYLPVPHGHPHAALLVEEGRRDEAERYGDADQTPVDPAPNGLFPVAYDGPAPRSAKNADDPESVRLGKGLTNGFEHG